MEEELIRDLQLQVKTQYEKLTDLHKELHQLPLCVSKYKPAIEEIAAHFKYLDKQLKKHLKRVEKPNVKPDKKKNPNSD